jgi:aerobic-type carbon monoxide dehydrogenase small subunit (CoxS/CutS family)
MDVTITLTVNGIPRTLTTSPEQSLLDVLREDLQLTGTKYGCGEGRCGACAVLIDGSRVLSCNTPAVQADRKTVTTIEGLGSAGALHPVQEAFLAEGAMQCGYCTPGMIVTAVAMLRQNPHPTAEEVTQGMNGNICRCGGYVRIVQAIRRAAGMV